MARRQTGASSMLVARVAGRSGPTPTRGCLWLQRSHRSCLLVSRASTTTHHLALSPGLRKAPPSPWPTVRHRSVDHHPPPPPPPPPTSNASTGRPADLPPKPNGGDQHRPQVRHDAQQQEGGQQADRILGGRTPEEVVRAELARLARRGQWKRRVKWVGLGLGVGIGVATFSFLHQDGPATPQQVRVLTALPSRGISALWGKLNDIELPVWLRRQIFLLWTWMYDCNLDEMRDPLDSYKNLGEFFTRHLKEGMRPMGNGMVSPVDGRVLIFGEVKDSQVEQIKGLTYELESLLGDTRLHLKVQDKHEAHHQPDKKLYHAVIYLAPGDYHGVHSPTDITVTHRRHFPGYLLPVAPTIVNLVKGLFALNERVALLGKWEHGFFSLIPVGATNVGSIALSIEKNFRTNLSSHKVGKGDGIQSFYERVYQPGIKLSKGEEVAFFKLGSTAVLIFEGPSEFEWTIEPGQRVKLNETIGYIRG